MFSRPALTYFAILLAIFLAFGQALPALVCALLLLTAGLARLWERWALERLDYSRELSQSRAFVGDEVELTLRIVNRKLLPLPTVEVHDAIPAGLEATGAALQRDMQGRQLLHRTTSLRWYEALTWRYHLRCDARGAYRLGPAQLQSGDPFGLYRSTRAVDQRTSLIVYPRLIPLDELGLPARHPIGDLRARQLIRDPLRTIGVRDYHPDDPLKDVHWPATARVGTLQTRVYEPTTARELAIFLDLDTFEHYWEGMDLAQVERLISAAATVAKAGLDEGYAVGLYVNGAPAEFEQLARLAPGRSPSQLTLIMETLARLTPYSITPMARLLRLAAGDLPWGATLLLISVTSGEALRASLEGYATRGRSVAWLFLGDAKPPRVSGVTLHHAPPRQDWRGMR